MEKRDATRPGSPTSFGGIWYWLAAIASILVNRELGQVAAFVGARMALAAAHIPETAEMPDGATAYMNALSRVPDWGKAAVIIGAVATLIAVYVVRSSIRRGWLAALVGLIVGSIVGAAAGFMQGYLWHP